MRDMIQILRLPLSIGLIVIAALSSQVLQAQESSYVATVIVNEAPIRSGPATKYYITDMLDRGSNVEVYKNISGWCAIRPPKGSFCWVPARQVRLDETGKVGEVIDPETYAWIGSNLSRPKEHGYQVQLHLGEKVAITGEKRFERKKEQITETWYKIEPPSGEFRWVETRFLSKPPATAANLIAASPASRQIETPIEESAPTTKASHDEPADAPAQEPAHEPAPLPSNSSRTAQPMESQSSPQSSAQSGPRKTGFRDVSSGRETIKPNENRSTNAATSPKGTPNQQVSFVEPFESRDSQTSSNEDSSRSPASAAPLPVGDFNERLASLETELVTAVAQPNLRDWNLATLRTKANQLKEMGATPLERGRASLLLDRIGLYESHQKQSLELDMQRTARSPSERAETPRNVAANAPWKPADEESPSPEPESGEQQPTDATPKKPNWMDKVTEVVGNGLKGGASDSTPTHFDAQGKLQRVRAKDESAPYPDYALVDEDGKITAFVDSPVLKLEKYVGKRIGVYGRRGLHKASQTTYIEAVEMVDLEIAQRTKPMRTTFGVMK